MVISVHPITPTDLPMLAAIHAEAFGAQAWSAAMFNDSLRNANVWGLLLASATQPIGFALCQQVDQDSEILTCAVLPSQQNRGFGRHLLQAIYDAAKTRNSQKIYLEVAADNQPAQHLYRNFGFQLDGTRRDYYPRGAHAVDALLMSLKI